MKNGRHYRLARQREKQKKKRYWLQKQLEVEALAKLHPIK